MSTVKLLTDMVKALPELSGIGSNMVLAAATSGDLGKISKEALTGMDVTVTQSGDYVIQKTGVHLVAIWDTDASSTKYWVGLFINRNANTDGNITMITIAGEGFPVYYSKWGTLFFGNYSGNLTIARITLPASSAILGGKRLTSNVLKIPLPSHLRHGAREIKHYELN